MKKNEKFSLQTMKWSIQCLFLYSDVNMTVFFSERLPKNDGTRHIRKPL